MADNTSNTLKADELKQINIAKEVVNNKSILEARVTQAKDVVKEIEESIMVL